VKLIIQPQDGVAPILAAIKGAKKSVEIAIFRFDHKDIETALKAAATQKSVKVTALIAHVNRGGEKTLRKLETRFLESGITVARSADDLIRYHDKFILIDRRTLYVFSFNFTHLDIDHSRGFGIVTEHAPWVKEAAKLFEADCMRSPYAAGDDTFVVSPANSRQALGGLLKRAKKQLLIYDPKIADKEILRILQDRAKDGVEIRIIGKMGGRASLNVQKLAGSRLHTRTIICDGNRAFIGSQSLRTAELDSRRELGLIVKDAKTVKKLMEMFESDWVSKEAAKAKEAPSKEASPEEERASREEQHSEAEAKETEKAVQVLEKQLDPLAATVKSAVRKAVAKAGDEVLNDKEVKDTMKKVVKRAVKEAVKEATEEANQNAS
jgi:cardiolipin synthase